MPTSSTSDPLSAQPLDTAGRIADLDVLRGFALLGVLLGVFYEFIAWSITATETQLAALPSAQTDAITTWVMRLLVADKANTLFAFLFGLGFSIQLARLRQRGADFETIYLRRLLILLAFGMLQMLLWFPWEILHLYALLGLVLFAMRNVSDRTLLVFGLPLLLFGYPGGQAIVHALLGGPGPQAEIFFSDPSILERQAMSAAGDHLDLMRSFANGAWHEWLVGGGIVVWGIYGLGRFLIGAWVGRQRWLERGQELLPSFRTGLFVALPAGLVLETLALSLEARHASEWISQMMHYLAVPLTAAGYVCLVVVGLRARGLAVALRVLAPVGRMALSNYVIAGLAVMTLFYGSGLGIGLAGTIGMTRAIGTGLLIFAMQLAFSHAWLRAFRFGPLEWGWRALTYGSLPPLRRRRIAPAA